MHHAKGSAAHSWAPLLSTLENNGTASADHVWALLGSSYPHVCPEEGVIYKALYDLKNQSQSQSVILCNILCSWDRIYIKQLVH